jgi:membrane protease subunit HflK
MREVVGRKTMDSVLYESRQEIAIEVRNRMQEMMDRYGTGILISAVAIQNAQPPEQAQAAFDDAVKAGQDRERQINEGQAYANDIVPKARGLASRLLQEADGYRTRVVETAQGDASRFRQILAEYQRAPAVTRDRMYIETMQQVFTNTTKALVDVRQSSQLLYLPFDKLMQQAMQDSAAPRPAPGVAPEPTPVPEVRSRDSLRSRERDAR